MEVLLNYTLNNTCHIERFSAVLTYEKKRKEKTTPFGVNLLRSPALYRAVLSVLTYSLVWLQKEACISQNMKLQ